MKLGLSDPSHTTLPKYLHVPLLCCEILPPESAWGLARGSCKGREPAMLAWWKTPPETMAGGKL